MDYSIHNSFLKVSVKPKGAELTSVHHLESGQEFLWQADPDVWGRHAPVLFPIVGQVKGGKYTFEGKEYALSQHGFARDREFKIEHQSEDQISLSLTYDDGSLKVYPFKFKLTITYSLEGAKLKSTYKVENFDHSDMYFSLGLHPGFQCPIESSLGFEDYYLEFNENESLDRLNLEGPFLKGETPKFLKGKRIDLKHDLFDDDALIFEGFQSSAITLKSDKSPRALEMGIKDFPLIGIWSKPNAGAPFVCIEPWFGVADELDGEKTYDQKKGIQKLEGKEVFKCESYIIVG